MILQTERLSLRELDPVDDAPFIFELVNQPKWIKFIGDRNVKTLSDAESYIVDGPLKSYEKNGFGLWLVEIRKTTEAIGLCGLLQREYFDSPDIGFAFLPAFEGKNYGYEAASATLHYARSFLGIKEVLATTDQQNVQSIKLLTKLGMQLRSSVKVPGEEKELFLFGTK